MANVLVGMWQNLLWLEELLFADNILLFLDLWHSTHCHFECQKAYKN